MSRKSSPPNAVTVQRQDLRVMFVRAAADTAPAIQEAWSAFERHVGLKGRKFYGTFDPGSGEYRVCAELTADDDPHALGLEVTTLRGGVYRYVRLNGEPPALYNQIPSTFDAMASSVEHDRSRPSIEFYRSRDVIDLFLPVAQASGTDAT